MVLQLRSYNRLEWRVWISACTQIGLLVPIIWMSAAIFRWPTRKHTDIRIYVITFYYTGCPRRNVPNFGRVIHMLKYTDITQNTYIKGWTVTEIIAREKWGFRAVPNTATRTADRHVTHLMSLRLIPGMNSVHGYTKIRSQRSFISTSI
jgi:hypothetical protein